MLEYNDICQEGGSASAGTSGDCALHDVRRVASHLQRSYTSTRLWLQLLRWPPEFLKMREERGEGRGGRRRRACITALSMQKYIVHFFIL